MIPDLLSGQVLETVDDQVEIFFPDRGTVFESGCNRDEDDHGLLSHRGCRRIRQAGETPVVQRILRPFGMVIDGCSVLVKRPVKEQGMMFNVF